MFAELWLEHRSNTAILGEKWAADDLGYWHENWLHTNSIDTAGLKRVLLLPRNLNRLVEIDWNSKQVVSTIASNQISHAHHARYVDADRIRVYDNNVPAGQTKVKVFDLNSNLLQETDLPFYSAAYGSVEVLPNGNILTVDGARGYVYELSSDASEIYLRIKYNKRDYIPFLNLYKPIVYRAFKIDSYRN